MARKGFQLNDGLMKWNLVNVLKRLPELFFVQYFLLPKSIKCCNRIHKITNLIIFQHKYLCKHLKIYKLSKMDLRYKKVERRDVKLP